MAADPKPAAPKAEAGYVLMPREPLPEIVAAWWQVKNRGGSDYDAYRAMVKRAEDPHAEV